MSQRNATDFNANAAVFERHRGLPGAVAEAIRSAVLALFPGSLQPTILDLGAGTGRIGRAFIEAGDYYIGLDSSFTMLREFSSRSGASLVQALGERLPFRDHAFDVVLLMQVLSSIPDWLLLLDDANRVLKPGGVVIAGQIIADPAGMEAQLKSHLKQALEEMGVGPPESEGRRAAALAWLQEQAVRHQRMTAISWVQTRTAREFLARKPTGHRFAQLAPAVQEAALARVSVWAISVLGSLDAEYPERQEFELNAFQFAS